MSLSNNQQSNEQRSEHDKRNELRILKAHTRWYAAQRERNGGREDCRRCGQLAHLNWRGYCSLDCELGYTVPAALMA